MVVCLQKCLTHTLSRPAIGQGGPAVYIGISSTATCSAGRHDGTACLQVKKNIIMQVNSFVLVHTPTPLLLELPEPQPTQCTKLKQCTTPATSTHPHKHCHTQSWFEISSGLLAHRPLCFTWSQLGTRPRLYYSQNVHPGATTGRNDHASQTGAPGLRAILRLW